MASNYARREFLRQTALTSAATLAVGGIRFGHAAGGRPRVVHAHHGRAVRWPRTTGAYRDYVDQANVDALLDQAVAALKGCSVDEAWRRVFPLDAPEQRRLSIKISCNNSTDATDGAGTQIDAIPEPAIAVLRGFLRAGGRESNVNIYDATNTAPTRFIATWFRNRVSAAHPGVLFNAPWGTGGSTCSPATCVPWSSGYDTPPPDTRYAGATLGADYVVNIPIVKRHGQANMSLGFKNHFGSIDRCDRLHNYVFNDTPNASVLADIMSGPSDPSVTPLYRRTVLTVGDMLFGQPCINWGQGPRPWKTWGNEWPNCFIVSDDVVAADSVMSDLLEPEPASDGGCGSMRAWSRRYLQVAESKGLGVFEHVALPSGTRFDASRMTYAKIDYTWLDLWSSGAALTVTRGTNGTVGLTWEHYFPGLCEVHRATKKDLSDGLVIGTTPTGRYVDLHPPAFAIYWVRFIG